MDDEATITAIKTLVESRQLADDAVLLDAITYLVKDQVFLPPEMPSWLRLRIKPLA